MVHDTVIVTARVTLDEMAGCLDDGRRALLFLHKCGMRPDRLPPGIGCRMTPDDDGLAQTYTFFHQKA